MLCVFPQKKNNKEELFYAELGALDSGDDSSAETPRNPAPQNATLYAEVVGTVSGALKEPHDNTA